MEPSTPNTMRLARIGADDRERKFEVICKVRPLQENERNEDIIIDEEAPSVTIFNHPKNTSKEFRFNRVFGDRTPQAEFSRALVDEVVGVSRQNGKGCLILSYGVTNSGKTYTIFGSREHPGLLPALISSVATEVRLRALEIYNDVPYCLRSGREVNEMRALESCQPIVVDEGNMEEVIGELINLRRTNETEANQSSSRSHAIFSVEWQGYHVAIADLAGNERFSENTNFTETVKINGNLLVLGQCITAFRDGGFLPYRRSKLTTVLMEYFKPPYKIYMVAHLNRSGQMFHENLNVLEYAAISTSIIHLYPNYAKNPSIAKSLRKPVANPTPARTPRSPAKKVIVTEEDLDREQNKYLLEHYKCFIMGVNAQAEADLDEYFRRQDDKDRLFIEELRATNYNGPTINHKKIIEEANAKSRIKLRQIFREEAMREHMEKQVDCATVMGQSILKDYYDKLQREEQYRKREWEEERRLMEEERVREEQLWREEKEHLQKEQHERARFIEDRLRAIEEERQRALEEERQMRQKGVDFSTSIGSSFKKASIPTGLNEQSLLTPQKLPAGADGGSFLRRMVSNPASMIESGYRMITNLHEVANQMMSTFRGLVCDQRPMPNNPQGQRMAAHVANIICSKQVAVVGEPDAERLVFVKEGLQASQEGNSQQQQHVFIKVQEVEFKDKTLEAKAAEQRRLYELREQDELREQEEIREHQQMREKERIRQQEEMKKKEEAEQMSVRIDVRQSRNIMGQAGGSQSSAPFQSQESTIMARQELSQSHSLAEESKQVSVLILQDFRESQKQQTILSNQNTSLLIPNYQQESMLLDGLRSEKDISTNRTSEFDLLRSDSTCKNQLLPIESIREADNETSTKPVLSRSPKPIHVVPASLRPYLNKQSEPTRPVVAVQANLNETGFKSTQQTFQAGSEPSKAYRSISQHKKSNKHRHCNERSNSRPVVNPPSRKENYLKRNRSKDSHDMSSRDISSIKTRNQRRVKK